LRAPGTFQPAELRATNVRIAELEAKLATVKRASELTANALPDWCRFSGRCTTCIASGSPWERTLHESFNCKLPNTLIDQETFETPHNARLRPKDFGANYKYSRLLLPAALLAATPAPPTLTEQCATTETRLERTWLRNREHVNSEEARQVNAAVRGRHPEA
jgi:hypothetical protein